MTGQLGVYQPTIPGIDTPIESLMYAIAFNMSYILLRKWFLTARLMKLFLTTPLVHFKANNITKQSILECQPA